MDKEFIEFLRKHGINPEEVKADEGTRSKMMDIFNTMKETEESSNEVKSRNALIMGTARAAVASATPAIKAGMLEFACTLVDDDKVSVDDAQRQLTDKVVELVKQEGTRATTTADDQQTERSFTVTRDPNAILNKQDIVSIYSEERSDRSLYEQAARSFIQHQRTNGSLTMGDIAKDLEGRSGSLVVVNESGSKSVRRSITAASQNVMIQAVYTQMLRAEYEGIEDETDRLVTIVPGSPGEGTIPEINISGTWKPIKEGEPYPMIGSTERELKLGHYKFGAGFSQTRESMLFDAPARATRILQGLASQGRNTRKEFRLARVLDSTKFDNRHVPHYGDDNGNNAFYVTTADELGNSNLLESNGLVDETDISAVRLKLAEMQYEPNSYVRPQLNVIVVPMLLDDTAWKIINAVYAPSIASADQTVQTLVLNPEGPMRTGRAKPTIITDPIISSLTSDNTTWYAGEPSKQFVEIEYWPLEVVPAKVGGDMEFRDIIAAWKGSFCSYIVSDGNKHFIKCTA